MNLYLLYEEITKMGGMGWVSTLNKMSHVGNALGFDGKMYTKFLNALYREVLSDFEAWEVRGDNPVGPTSPVAAQPGVHPAVQPVVQPAAQPEAHTSVNLTPSDIARRVATRLARGEDQWTAEYREYLTKEWSRTPKPRRLIEKRAVNLFRLYQEVAKQGGIQVVEVGRKMTEVVAALGFTTPCGPWMKRFYRDFLFQFEQWEVRDERGGSAVSHVPPSAQPVAAQPAAVPPTVAHREGSWRTNPRAIPEVPGSWRAEPNGWVWESASVETGVAKLPTSTDVGQWRELQHSPWWRWESATDTVQLQRVADSSMPALVPHDPSTPRPFIQAAKRSAGDFSRKTGLVAADHSSNTIGPSYIDTDVASKQTDVYSALTDGSSDEDACVDAPTQIEASAVDALLCLARGSS